MRYCGNICRDSKRDGWHALLRLATRSSEETSCGQQHAKVEDDKQVQRELLKPINPT